MTWSTARADLADALRDVNAAGVTVYDHVPVVDQTGVVASIDRSGASSTMTDWTFIVRVYVRASIPDVQSAQLTVDEMIDAFEAVFDRQSLTATWRTEYLAEFDVWLTEWSVIYPRQDF